ncbi:hypothetical protein LSM04_007355 [Trypanosoma melophagium]|uniref:uncharacterized protein n=1 Tax=Trypanosoma melophagium TaxID=715481 RepID=UPI00351A99D8|nr:hypothetical protein LSM04_007355 [Trypanosoma melophagium]
MAQRDWSGSNQWYSQQQQQQQQQQQMQMHPPPPPPPSPSSQPHQQVPSQQFGPVPQWQSMNGVNMPNGMMPPPSYSMSYGPQLTPPPPSWGQAPPLYQQTYIQPGCCDTTACCGPPGQADPCNCCSPAVGGVGCCCSNNGPVDLFCCGPPTTPGCSSCLTSRCDWTYCVMLFFTLLSVVGFIIVMIFNKNDDLFQRFEADDTVGLQKLLQNEIVSKGNVCTSRSLLTIGGTVCLEGNLNANTFVVQLSAWNTARDALYFIAMVFSIFTFVYANLVDYQRKNVRMQSMEGQFQQQQQQQQKQEERPRQQNERKKQQQKQGKEPPVKSKQKDNGRSASQQPNRQLLGPPMIRGPIEVYGTPFYEFMRIAWFVMGVAVFLWVCNMMVSFWKFSSFYRNSTTGKLHEFFEEYNVRFSASVICVTIYLAWPLVNIFVELALWVFFFIPWVIIRSICKPGIGRLRPALPLDEMPGWVRLDMFFMDFNDIRRIGFSEPAWTLLTGSTAPLMSCCIDPTIDRDPTMSTWQQQQQQQWYARMQGMYPMGMVLPHTSPATVPVAAQGQTHSVDMRAVNTTDANNNNDNSDNNTGGGGESSSKSRRHHEGRSSSRHKHRSSRGCRERDEDDVIAHDADVHSFTTSATPSISPSAAVVAISPNANNTNTNNNTGGDDDGKPRRRHRSSSAIRHRSRHRDGTRTSRHAGGDDGGETNGEGGESRSRHRRHSSSRHRRHSSRGHSRHESYANVNNTTNNANNHTNDRPDRVNNADLDRMLDEL